MADERVWFITGAGRGMGVDIAQAALGAGYAVVATGRNTEAVTDAVSEADDLLVVELDITSLASAEAAVQAAMEPGFFRTELLEKESTAYADLSIDDYAERTAQTRPAWEAMSGKQGGDPAKLAKALVTVVDQEQPPLRWVAGADAVETVEQKANDLLAQVDAYRSLSSSLALDEAQAGRER
jgi:NAD(P)-dependent dehydrogenase (short-subunit alcohol dehydrogenase family)